LLAIAPAVAGPAQDTVLARYAAEAKAANPAFAGFSAERGKTLFHASFGTGKPDTPSCTTCHTENPTQPGRTRAGKTIPPLALSAKGDRYSDIAETEKWFGRNCESVIGRACTPLEKGDFISFMITQ
jgi:cytochrome c553